MLSLKERQLLIAALLDLSDLATRWHKEAMKRGQNLTLTQWFSHLVD